MGNAHDAEDAIMAYREEVEKTMVAYRKEVEEIIQEIPRKIFARLVELTPTAREAVLSAICNGRALSSSWRTSPKDQQNAYIEELKAVLAEVEYEDGRLKIGDKAGARTATRRKV
jgi:hypothetical protein